MTQTATRSKRTATAPAAPQTHEVEVGRGGKHIIDKLANARADRLAAERVEDPLKERWRGIWEDLVPAGFAKGDTLVIKALGVVRGRVTLRSRGKSIDLDLLLSAFPEAYQACVTETESLQFDPA